MTTWWDSRSIVRSLTIIWGLWSLRMSAMSLLARYILFVCITVGLLSRESFGPGFLVLMLGEERFLLEVNRCSSGIDTFVLMFMGCLTVVTVYPSSTLTIAKAVLFAPTCRPRKSHPSMKDAASQFVSRKLTSYVIVPIFTIVSIVTKMGQVLLVCRIFVELSSFQILWIARLHSLL